MRIELSRNAQPVHRVTFNRPFYFGVTEVTFAEYDAFCEATGRSLLSDEGWGRDDRPVIFVDWHDARDYTRWLGAMTDKACRLPSEAEWEYAARAGTTAEYAVPAPMGSNDIAGLANCFDCGSGSGAKTTPVSRFPANVWGLRDMHGNVWEWVEDCWHESYDGAPDDGRAWLEGNGGNCALRVARGGSWLNFQDGVRSGSRGSNPPGNRDNRVGFRVVCSSPIIDP